MPHLFSTLFLSSLCFSVACSSDKDQDDEQDGNVVTDTANDGDGDTAEEAVDFDQDGFKSDEDCDDANAAVYPGAEEICDQVDNDCDGETDEGVSIMLFLDTDSDGYGDPNQGGLYCQEIPGYVQDSTDCDDADDSVYPGSHAIETPGDGKDQDCDGVDACLDLNCDGWPDILVAESDVGSGNAAEIRLYFGSETGYSEESVETISTIFASQATTADLNGDGYIDIFFTEDATYWDGQTQARASVYWGSADGYSPFNRYRLPVENSWGMTVFDLNGDAHLELAVSSRDENQEPGILILMGSEGGYDMSEPQFLNTQDVVSQLAAADVNGDSHLDLVVATWSAQNAAVYWGSDEGFDANNRTNIGTDGYCWDLLIDDFNGDSFQDLLITHQLGSDGADDFSGPSHVFWGNSSGLDFSQSTALNTHAAAGACAGDLNADGYTDAVVTSIEWNAGSDTGQTATIYWGGPSGLSDSDTTEISATGSAACSIYDLNLDGYLDLVIGNQSNGVTAMVDSKIHWGSETGLDVQSWTLLPTRGVYSVVSHPFEGGY